MTFSILFKVLAAGGYEPGDFAIKINHIVELLVVEVIMLYKQESWSPVRHLFWN